MKKIVFVCLGNICRSPMAEFVMKDLTNQYEIESRATSNWEHGNPIHQGTQKIFRSHGVPYDVSKTSLQISDQDFHTFDLILGMDENNVADLKRMAPPGTRAQDSSLCRRKCSRSMVHRRFRRDLSPCPSWLSRVVGTIRRLVSDWLLKGLTG